jgi:hypothetical protein
MELAEASLPNCTDKLPAPIKVLEVTNNGHTVKMAGARYENCQITLDSAHDDERINTVLTNKYPWITFGHCLVIYRGGPVNLLLTWSGQVVKLGPLEHPEDALSMSLYGNTIEFENCLLDFSVRGAPPKTGQELTASLLTQNTAILKLPSAENRPPRN